MSVPTSRSISPGNTPTASAHPQQLLYSRKDVARLLGGVCIATIIRYEKSGLLKPIRLSPKGQVFYRARDLAQLVDELSKSNGDMS